MRVSTDEPDAAIRGAGLQACEARLQPCPTYADSRYCKGSAPTLLASRLTSVPMLVSIDVVGAQDVAAAPSPSGRGPG